MSASVSPAPRAARSPWSGHFPVLDGVRGLAIAMVMALHFIGDAPAEGALALAVKKLCIYGVYGVDLFFVLSGFLITGILYEAKAKPSYFRNFYARRSLRIFPLYYGVLVLILLVLPRVPLFQGPLLDRIVEHQAWAWLYGMNVLMALEGAWTFPYVEHFWSLAVEEHFYLVWPFVVFWLPRKKLLWTSAALIAFSLGLRVWMAATGVNEIAQYTLTPVRFDGLCLGAFLAVAVREREESHAWLRKAGWWLLGVGAGGIALTYGVNAVTEAVRPAMVALRTSGFAAVFGALIALGLTAEPRALLRRFFESAPMTFLGKYSYGLYVFHAMVSYWLLRSGALGWVEPYVPWKMVAVYGLAAAGIAVSIAVALVSFHGFEKHWLHLKSRFEARPAAPAQVPAPSLSTPPGA